MKKTFIASFFALFSLVSYAQENDMSFINENVDFAAKQYDLMLKNAGEPNGKNFPRTIGKDGKLRTTSLYDWTPGFFPGSLWYLYELTGDEKWKADAKKWTEVLEPNKSNTSNHDVGFMMYCSYGNAIRFIPNDEYKNILIQTANSLCTRFSPKVGLIKSWNSFRGWEGSKCTYPVIIDNMMNLELLMYAWEKSGDEKFYNVAVSHAKNTLKNHFRKDFSSYHVVEYDSNTGKPLKKLTAQGYSNNSTWSRGQAWAVYGFTMMYRESKKKEFLKMAENTANYFIKHLPSDNVPGWDFNAWNHGYAPDGNSNAKVYYNIPKDASAAAIVCSALFDLASLSGKSEYRKTAVDILKTLSSNVYRAKLGENQNFIIMHCTGALPQKSEIDVPLVYADYYYLEALTKYKKYLNNEKK